MYHVIVRHRIGDYKKWRPVFDAHQSDRVSAGLHEPRVFRNVDRPEQVVIQLRCDNLRLAREFFNSDNLKQKMSEAGVVGQPETVFLEEL